jgi:hypothetical protein
MSETRNQFSAAREASMEGRPGKEGFAAIGPDHAAKPAVRQPPNWVTVLTCLLLALAVWFVFGQTRHHEFINFDDDVYVSANSTIA